ncbi:biotin--[acetyl-CoA-carboxylase] ligase [Candidatus Borrarchaeum sp.]|uniref:biotin--[acetyl-CoA-carboxylase] ligase n=1 Tax=Candidatus Borrarchaeum sp. TaxID=2846742 RepID=UPI00257BBD5D|nr:biotin--[acetyl-CoA-carboxylase] ligase [Candidatus Borrarchaeum sp.]
MTNDFLSPDIIKDRLRTEFIGREIRYFDETGSTNDIAKELARKGALEGLLVLAETQTSGRGRLGRVWQSPPGGIWLSLILRPRLAPQEAPKLTFIGAIAVATAIRNLGLDAKIKWPNDVLVSNRKICGILTEMESETDVLHYVVVGIGINANFNKDKLPAEIQKTATTLKSELKESVNRNEFITCLLNEFERSYLVFLEKGFSPILEEWKELSCILNEDVRVYMDNRIIDGKAIDVDQASGALILKLDNGSFEKIFSGDVSIRRQK